MFEIAKLTPLHLLELPSAIASQFAPGDRFIVWMEGDTVHFKRIASSPLQAVEDAHDADEPMTLEEINDVVHKVRRELKAARPYSSWSVGWR